MPKMKRLRGDRPYYLLPIMVGMLGVLFSSQLEDPLLRGTVVLMCVAVPLFLGGNVLGRVYSRGLQRYLLFASMAMLTLGAVITVSGYSKSLFVNEMVSKQAAQLSLWIGTASLFLGLLAVFFTVLRSEAVIEELRDRFSHVADHISEGIVLMDTRGEIILANRALCEMTGLKVDELVGRKSLDLGRENAVEAIVLHEQARLHGVDAEYRVSWNRKGTEHVFIVRETAVHDRHGHRAGTLSTVLDVTETHNLSVRLEEYTQGLQKLVEGQTQKLRESEKKFRDLLVHMDEGFLTIDSLFRILFANTRIRHVLKAEDSGLVGRKLLDLVSTDERDRLNKALNSVHTRGPGQASQEYTFLREDGIFVPVKVSIAPVNNAPDGKTRFSIVVTDVQELKDMQHQLEHRARQLEQANEELRELDRSKDVFLSNVSHELRTPLSTLQGYVEMWTTGSLGEVDGPQAGALKVMERNVNRLSMMINEMLEFTRMEIRGVRLHETLFNIESLIRECVDSAHPHVLKKDISVTTFVPDGTPPIWGDREKLGQVIGILLSNAIKFSHEQSLIHIRVATTDIGSVTLDVTDTGIGIDLPYQERIFSKFYQVDSSLTRHYQGTGIGLSIARSIIKAHGGEIELESEIKKGSTFTVVLPDAVFESDLPKTAIASLNGITAVLANNQPEFRSAVSDILRKLGCEVEEYASGHDCARAASQIQPHIILVDEALPDLSGTDTTALLQQDVSTGDIPVILFRSTTPQGRPETHLFDGVHILHKPFAVSALVAKVNQLITADDGPPTTPLPSKNTQDTKSTRTPA